MDFNGLCDGRGRGPRWFATQAITALVMLSLVPTPAWAQVNERDSDESSPRGSPLDEDQQRQERRPEDEAARSDDSSGSGMRSSTESMQTRIGTSQPNTNALTNREVRELRNPRLKPPAGPDEYERWVLSVTGKELKRFGTELLLPSDRDYAVPAVSTIPPDYPLSVGDTVSIALTGSIEGSADFEINRNGVINMPQVGAVRLVGVRYRDLKDRIAAAVGRQYRGFEVSVSIKQLRGVRVYVTGFANNPGAYTVNSLSTLVNAVLAAGGPSSGGSFRSVKLYRNGHEVVDFDLYDLIRRGDKSRDPVLQNEDVLFIPPVGKQTAVVGSVNEEAIYEIRPGETLEDLLRLAGGPTSLADSSRLIVYRMTDRDSTWGRQLARSAAGTEQAEAGDILQILSEGSLVRPLERQSTIVRIEGEVNKPGNYYVTPGTSLATIIEMAGGTTSRAYVYGTVFARESVRAQQRKSYREAVDQMETVLATAPLTQDRSAENSGVRDTQLTAARSYLQKLRSVEPDGRLVLDLSPATTTLPGDIIVENNDRISIPPRVDTVGVFGAVYRPASFLLGKPKKVGDYVEQAGGTLRAADRGNIFVVRANGEVITKQRGALSAAALPGDVVFVPVRTQSTSLISRIKDITTIIFQLGFAAAAIAAID